MTLRSSLLPVFTSARQLIQDLGLRQHRVFIRTRAWSADEVHLGTVTETDVEILPRPKVKQLGNGRWEISKVTPSYSGGGWTPEQLLPTAGEGEDVTIILRGPDGIDHRFRVAEVNPTGNFGYTLYLDELERSRPDFG